MTSYSRYSYSDGTLTLLPCTMEDGVFVTNVKWKGHGLVYNRIDQYFLSPGIHLHDLIKNKPIKTQLRLMKLPNNRPDSCFYVLQYWHDNEWKFYVTIYNPNKNYEFIAHLPNNFYYSSKTLVDDLRQHLASIQGETFAFGDEIHSIQECFKETLLAFIEQEYNEDFVIECQGNEFKIKKILLQARSPVFNAMLSSNNFKEARENRMVIKDCGSEVVEKMIEFFQTDFIKDTTEYEIELYEISRKYISESFMEFTRLPFVNSLTIGNYDKLLRIVGNHNDKETEELMNEWYSKNHQRRL